MAIVPYASLSQRGIINSPEAIMLALFKSWIATDPTQSNIFAVSTLGEIIRISEGSPGSLNQLATVSLENLYRPHFDEAYVQIEVKDLTDAPDSLTRYDLHVYVTTKNDGETYQLSQVITDAYGQGDPLIKRVLNGETT